MKKIILSALLLLSLNGIAQTWIQVPDVNFQNYLTAHYPAGAFMTSGSDFFVDADFSDIQNEDTLNVTNQNISSVEGIIAFGNLIEFNCQQNALTSVPELPASLLSFNCQVNQLTSLPDLPPGLLVLVCSENQITQLPDLPGTLLILHCYYNQLTDLPPLPNDLMVLNVAHNLFESLPGVLPSALKMLICSENQLTELPALPSTLEELQCSSNQIAILPTLPTSLLHLFTASNPISDLGALPPYLQMLDCQYCNLTSLPTLPNSLTTLFCGSNNISILPVLPGNLGSLGCQDTYITDLPTLPPTLNYFVCWNAQISCFPEFPSSITTLSIYDNPFTCLSNYIPAMDAFTLSYPLCTENDPVNNPNGCQSAMGIMGEVFNDANNDCVNPGGDLMYVPMAVSDNGGTLLTSSTSLVNGEYYFSTGQGDYEVSVNTATLSPALQVNCPINNELTATVTTADPVVDAGDFGLACAGFDLGVQSVVPQGWFFPGQTHELQILAGDLTAQYNMHCATGISGEVVVTVNGPGTVTFGGTPSSVIGNVATYSIADFGAIGANLFSASVLTDTTAQANDEFCVSVDVNTSATGDLDPSNDSYTFCYHVVNSYDPNVKLTTPELVAPGYEDDFTYTIYFQNTVNAPAFNIRLADTLDANLDLSTLKFVNASHDFTTSVSATSRLLTIRFPNIMLVDSTSDPDGSIGFIQYQIKPVAGLPNWTIIENTAYIYFDFNSPIVTNTSQNVFGYLGLKDEASTVQLYPNPASNKVIIEADEAIERIEFYSLDGTRVATEIANSKKTHVNVSDYNAGIYLVKVYTNSGIINKRLVIR